MTDTAQLFTGVHDTPVYTNIVFNKPLRIWVAVPAVLGTITTALLTVVNLASGHALAILVCGLLVTSSPEYLEGCPGLLQRACSVIADFRPGLSEARGNRAVLDEAQRLQFAVRHAARLLESALNYHVRWNQILGAMTGGYTEHGDPAPVPRQGRVCLTG